MTRLLCGYYSESKHESCELLRGHAARHFDYGEDQRPMLFSAKVALRREDAKRRSVKKPKSPKGSIRITQLLNA